MKKFLTVAALIWVFFLLQTSVCPWIAFGSIKPNLLVILVLTLFVWLCMGLIYISGLVLGLLSTVIALLGVAVLITYSPQNGVILLVIAFLISPMGLPLAAIWLLGKVQDLKFAIQDWMYG